VSGFAHEVNAPEDPRSESQPHAASAERMREALDVATDLHTLALQYRSERRFDDARRVASQAATILRQHVPDSEVLDDVMVTLRGL
jgi:hypothetical protein